MRSTFTPEEIKEAGLDDFRVFLVQVWDFLGLPAPTPVQLDVAYWLQHGPRRAILQAFRGVGKSWMTVAFVLWLLLLNPQLKILVVSANQKLADDFSKFCRQIIDGMELLHHLRPRGDQRDSGIAFDVGPATPSKDPSVKSAGITGQITGNRADVIVFDDIEVPKNALTHVQREKLAESVKEGDAVLKPGGRIVYLGTPQVESSVYNRLAKRGYTRVVYPIEIPKNTDTYGGCLAPYVLRKIKQGAPPGTLLEPTRFPQNEIDERRLSYGAGGYALQFMLDTNPAEAERHPLKLKDLIVYDADLTQMAPVRLVWDSAKPINDLECGGFDGDGFYHPGWKATEMADFTGTVMAIDPSGRGQDETGYAIIKYLYGLLYLVDVGGFTDGFGEATLKALAGKALRWGVNNIITETNYGGGMFDQLLKPHLVSVGLDRENPDRSKPPAGKIDEEWIKKFGWSSGQKELRILDTLEPIVRNHKLVVSRRVIEEDWKQQNDKERYSFVQQFTRMARLKGCLPNEDRLEAVAMATSYFTEKMNRDQEQMHSEHIERLRDAELDKFVQHALGNFAGDGARSDRLSRGYYRQGD